MVCLALGKSQDDPALIDSELESVKAGSSRATTPFLAKWEPTVRRMALAYVERASDLDDFCQLGRIGLLRAVHRFQPDRGVPFEHYASRTLKRVMLKERLRLRAIRQRESHLPNPGTLEEQTLLDCRRQIDSVIEWADVPERYASIHELIYVSGLSQREAAARLNVSQPRISQMHRAFIEFARNQYN